MRELSFSQLWPKLATPRPTTFRFARKDKDWQVGETVKVLFKARSPKDRSVLGLAVIVKKEPRWVRSFNNPRIDYTLAMLVTEKEAQADGFSGRRAMVEYMGGAYLDRMWKEPMNKLTLAWTHYWLYVPEQKPHVQKEWSDLLVRDNFHGYIQGGFFQQPGARYIIHQGMLTDIHNEAALGSMTL